jgi:hypothetical protein
MSMKALNQLLGRSAIDPGVARAFQAGRIGELLAKYDFSPSLLEVLTALTVDTFEEFAKRAYQLVDGIEEAKLRSQVPSPAEGLQSAPFCRREERAA